MYYYNKENEVSNEIVFIKENVYKNKELMMNFTHKAMNSDWIEQAQQNP